MLQAVVEKSMLQNLNKFIHKLPQRLKYLVCCKKMPKRDLRCNLYVWLEYNLALGWGSCIDKIGFCVFVEKE